jgi:hypothetical protein
VFLEAFDQLLGRRLLLGLAQAFSALANELAQVLAFGLGIRHGDSWAKVGWRYLARGRRDEKPMAPPAGAAPEVGCQERWGREPLRIWCLRKTATMAASASAMG